MQLVVGKWKTFSSPIWAPIGGPYRGPHYFHDANTISIKIDTELTRRLIGNGHTKMLDFLQGLGALLGEAEPRVFKVGHLISTQASMVHAGHVLPC